MIQKIDRMHQFSMKNNKIYISFFDPLYNRNIFHTDDRSDYCTCTQNQEEISLTDESNNADENLYICSSSSIFSENYSFSENLLFDENTKKYERKQKILFDLTDTSNKVVYKNLVWNIFFLILAYFLSSIFPS